MDGRTFDRMARLLAGRLTRRTGAGAALAGLAGLAGMLGLPGAATPGIGVEAAARKRGDGRGRTHDRDRAASRDDEVEDEKKPCGPKARDNRCRRDKDCCTRYCRKPKKGSTAKVGRCRCIKPGKKCKNGQKCCGGATCQNRRCTPMPVPPACAATGGACTEDANCCTGLICEQGLCAPCVETVCASGCQFTSVNAAYAAATTGDTIYIGSGTYPTGIVIDKDITLSACPGVTDAILTPDRLVQEAKDSYYVVMTYESGPSVYSVTLKNLTLTGTADGVPPSDEVLLNSYEAELNWTVINCTLSNAYFAIYSAGGNVTIADSTLVRNSTGVSFYYLSNALSVAITDSTFKDFYDGYLMDFYYGDTYDITVDVQRTTFTNNDTFIYADTLNVSDVPSERAKTSLTFTDCDFTDNLTQALYVTGGVVTITNCTFTGNKATPIEVDECNLTINNTTISGNEGEFNSFLGVSQGGGVRIDAYDANASLTLGAGTVITGNTADEGAGLMTFERPGKTLTLIGVSSSTIFGNLVGPDCSDLAGSGYVAVPNCAYP